MNISVRTILKVLSVTALFIGALALGWMARQQLSWIFTAAFLALAMNPAVDFFSRYMPRKSRGLAIGVVLALVAGLLAVLLVSFVPPMVAQTNSLVRNMPRLTDQLVHHSGFVSDLIKQYDLVGRIQTSQSQLTGYASSAGTQLFGLLRELFYSFVTGITVLGLMFFMLLEGPKWLETLWRVVPERRNAHARRLAGQMYRAVSGYVTGNLLTSLIAGLVTAAMLTIAGVPYAVPLGILVGILDLLPMVGATIASVVVITVALFTSMTAAVVMLIFFVIYQQLENHVLQPLVYGKTVQISPLVVLVAVLLGAALDGMLGAIVAIPLAASLQILVKDYAERHWARG
jgi:predicted PurR-regulated permease PerM